METIRLATDLARAHPRNDFAEKGVGSGQVPDGFDEGFGIGAHEEGIGQVSEG
ncbi:MAG: hypothetical protein U1G07_22900 [Verrucomicrobiota bacterium]